MPGDPAHGGVARAADGVVLMIEPNPAVSGPTPLEYPPEFWKKISAEQFDEIQSLKKELEKYKVIADLLTASFLRLNAAKPIPAPAIALACEALKYYSTLDYYTEDSGTRATYVFDLLTRNGDPQCST